MWQDILTVSSITSLAFLVIAAFFAGFIDAVVGGGGLIQIPSLLIQLPNTPPATIFGTNKIAALSGTTIAAWKYSKKVSFLFKLIVPMGIVAFIASFAGAKLVTIIPPHHLKPIILILLIAIAVYTLFKKDIGISTQNRQAISLKKKLIVGLFMSLLIGFYDGFFGPGTGSFFVIGFVLFLHYDFLTASAYAKVINCITNIAALVVFIRDGHYIFSIAVIMALANIAGGYIGASMAIKKGNSFVKTIFIVVVFGLIAKFGYEILKSL